MEFFSFLVRYALQAKLAPVGVIVVVKIDWTFIAVRSAVIGPMLPVALGFLFAL